MEIVSEIFLYRARIFHSKENIIGFYFPEDGEHFILTTSGDKYKIDFNTLAISPPNMLDKKNTRIFASLNFNGRGSDILNRDGQLFYVVYKVVNARFDAYEISGNHRLLAHKFYQTNIVGEYNGNS